MKLLTGQWLQHSGRAHALRQRGHGFESCWVLGCFFLLLFFLQHYNVLNQVFQVVHLQSLLVIVSNNGYLAVCAVRDKTICVQKVMLVKLFQVLLVQLGQLRLSVQVGRGLGPAPQSCSHRRQVGVGENKVVLDIRMLYKMLNPAGAWLIKVFCPPFPPF